jgi:hypothetical protein
VSIRAKDGLAFSSTYERKKWSGAQIASSRRDLKKDAGTAVFQGPRKDKRADRLFDGNRPELSRLAKKVPWRLYLAASLVGVLAGLIGAVFHALLD